MSGTRRTMGGFTLVELMIAMLLGLILTAGASYMFIAQKETYQTSDAVARLQERGRFVLQMVTRDLRMAGHIGCARFDRDVNISASGLAGVHYPQDAVTAKDADGDSNPDTLVVRYASANAEALSADASASPLKLGSSVGLSVGDYAVVADCSKADIVEVTGVSDGGTTIGFSGSLSGPYPADGRAEVMRFVTNEYRVVADGTNAHGDTLYALNRNGEALVDGVEFMSAQFGECVSGNNQRFLDWSSGGLVPENIRSVRLGFLVQSEDRVLEAPDTSTYSVAGTDVAAAGEVGSGPTHDGDTRLRKVYSTTVSLRNPPKRSDGGC